MNRRMFYTHFQRTKRSSREFQNVFTLPKDVLATVEDTKRYVANYSTVFKKVWRIHQAPLHIANTPNLEPSQGETMMESTKSTDISSGCPLCLVFGHGRANLKLDSPQRWVARSRLFTRVCCTSTYKYANRAHKNRVARCCQCIMDDGY
ncbi:unnamed protein product [Ectocarpus sp. 13 AM-2016]